MSTEPSNPPHPPFKLSARDSKQQQQQERARVDAIKNAPEQRLIAQQMAEPPVTPLQPSFRECIIDNLSLAEMSLIQSQSGTLEYLHAVHKVTRFSLWASYCKELKAMEVRQVRVYCREATATRSTEMRDAYRHLACMYAIFHLVRDPSVRAEREMREVSAATVATQRTDNARRL